MFIVNNYSLAIILCIVTMVCWGSWGNTLKLAGKSWRYELYYWDYVIGIFLFSIIMGLTLGSCGEQGRPFLTDLGQVSTAVIASAIIGGVIFNGSNILLSASTSIAGMSVAFPLGVGLALVLGVFINYFGAPKGDPIFIFSGVGLIIIALILNGLASARKGSKSIIDKRRSCKGILLAMFSGVLMSFFYRFVAAAMDLDNFVSPQPGKATPYTAFFLFSLVVIGCGLTFLETSANPYVTVLGNAEASEQRINFSQSFNGLGWILGPLAGGWFLFSQDNSPNIALPYAIIGLVVLLIGGVFCFVRLPEIKDTVSPEEVSGHQDDPRDENRDLSTTTVESSSTLSEIRILSRKSAFVFGWVALFLYVAAQTGVNSFFINYATEHIAITDSMAATLLSFGGMGLFMLGRLGGSWAMGRIRAERLLAILAIIATLATSAVVLAPGGLGFAALLVVYLCESIMFPTIFALALRGLGAHTKIASSLLIMSIVGGAVAPLLMGIVADGHSMALGFIVPLVCFVVIAAYAISRR